MSTTDRAVTDLSPDGLHVLLLFLLYFKNISNDSCRTNYLKIYRIDLRQIFKIGRLQMISL